MPCIRTGLAAGGGNSHTAGSMYVYKEAFKSTSKQLCSLNSISELPKSRYQVYVLDTEKYIYTFILFNLHLCFKLPLTDISHIPFLCQ